MPPRRTMRCPRRGFSTFGSPPRPTARARRPPRGSTSGPALPPPILNCSPSGRSSRSIGWASGTTGFTRSWTPVRPSRGATSTSTCGTATRPCSLAGATSPSTCCASAGAPRSARRVWSSASSTSAKPRAWRPRPPFPRGLLKSARPRLTVQTPTSQLPLGGGRWRPLLVLVLELIELVVDPAKGEQLLVRAGFAQVPFVQDEDLVHVLDRRQPVGDGDRRAA